MASSFYEILTEAINDMADHGYDSQARLDGWLMKLRTAAASQAAGSANVDDALRRLLSGVYNKALTAPALAKVHPGVSRFTVDMIKPKLQQELSNRVAASANLIKLRKGQRIDDTLARFSGWATSVPAGGSDVVDKREVKASIYKPLQRLPFEERRIHIDQGAKFVSAMAETIAIDGNAIAMRWHSRWRQPGYNYRPDHKERDGLIYLVPGSWALKQGLIKPVHGYVDDITRPAEEVFCKCSGHWVYTVSSLPDEYLTEKGRQKIADAKKK